jgi:hypothetical protein
MHLPPQQDAGAQEVTPRMERRAKWTAHAASRVCAVPGCVAFATATLRVDDTEPVAWLVDLDPDRAGDDLCARHADALREGDGWVLHDGRRQNQLVDRSVVEARHGRTVAPSSPTSDFRLDLRAAGRAITDGIELVDGYEDYDEYEDLAYDEDGDADLLDARSPLLRRAFAKSRDA